MQAQKPTQVCALKWIIVCYVNFTQFKKVNFNVKSERKLEDINITSVPWGH